MCFYPNVGQRLRDWQTLVDFLLAFVGCDLWLDLHCLYVCAKARNLPAFRRTRALCVALAAHFATFAKSLSGAGPRERFGIRDTANKCVRLLLPNLAVYVNGECNGDGLVVSVRKTLTRRKP